MFSRNVTDTWTRANCTVAISNSASPEIIWGLGGPEEDHQLHQCCWTGYVGEQEEEKDSLIIPVLIMLCMN